MDKARMEALAVIAAIGHRAHTDLLVKANVRHPHHTVLHDHNLLNLVSVRSHLNNTVHQDHHQVSHRLPLATECQPLHQHHQV